MTLKKGQPITGRGGITYTVLLIVEDMILISFPTDPTTGSYWYTEEKLREKGFAWTVPAWEPKVNDAAWGITYHGEPFCFRWTDSELDHETRDFLGVFPTREAAEARREEIKGKIK